jgi:hypothetical protein
LVSGTLAALWIKHEKGIVQFPPMLDLNAASLPETNLQSPTSNLRAADAETPNFHAWKLGVFDAVER